MLRKMVTGATLALSLLGSAVSAQAESIKLAVTDLVGLEELQREFGPFKAELERTSGLEIEFLPVTNRTAALEALRFKKVDFVLAGPAEYVVMQKRANAKIVTGLYRPNYFSLIVVKADSPIYSPLELKGKNIGFGSVGSTSRHLGPIQLLSDAGLEPAKDTKAVHTNLRLAWEGLKKDDLQAVGMGRSDLEGFLAQEPEDQRNAYRVLARGGDLPNDLLMAGEHVPEATVETLKRAIVDNSDSLIASISQGGEHTTRYVGMRFLTSIADKDYNVVRSMYRTAGYPEYSDFIGE
ncbi:PhnD/SsuA/transferrin family substrate-binding protein [Pseudomonas sp. TTU2014-080ASC]|jgi:phosphonate transport system substrate-binding protein|uniref:PhnD/SsuA/transferrin family substrate-binding protein n=1 Tax=Pseudomonas sp. TTU2014-080ASC TaxID=1729724 RepID=UPI0007183697|nr:PhnD/SsuA/transferrin family substrate-binding protein [Pseudomonas sp. TTU2014-080ASC]KRW60999.1 phosphonate ABC transporter substrate-binding protein [Pseudomonas sp. TTU2014-080ASC]